MNFLKVLFYLVFPVNMTCVSQVSVTLPTGTYQGQMVKTHSGENYYSFTGIKYAMSERFQASIPVPDSNNTYDATHFGPACYQNNETLFQYQGVTVPMSEDCLYLNVFSPQLNGSLPVIVYIHGGDFICGTVNTYLSDLFMDTKNVVVVNMAYRLSLFGFLYMDDPNYPANNGIRDQILALRWVQSYIKQFGGDPSRVTLNGQSAGSVSIEVLMNSPLAKGLFVGAIGESGVDSSRWAVQPRCTGIDRRNMLALTAGCFLDIPLLPGGNADRLVQCLKNKTADDLIAATKNCDPRIHPVTFPVTIEQPEVSNPVITYAPWLKPINSSTQVPWITGVNSNEGKTLVRDDFVMYFNSTIMKIGFYLAADLIFPELFLYKNLAKSPKMVSDALAQQYYGLFKDLKQLITQIVSDGYFYYPFVRSSMPVGSPMYFYYFDFLASDQTDGVGHNGELAYIWPNASQIQQLQPNSNAANISRDLVNAWVHFAYYQIPVIVNVTWERYNYVTDRVLTIDNNGIRMENNPTRQAFDFWSTLDIDSSPKVNFC